MGVANSIQIPTHKWKGSLILPRMQQESAGFPAAHGTTFLSKVISLSLCLFTHAYEMPLLLFCSPPITSTWHRPARAKNHNSDLGWHWIKVHLSWTFYRNQFKTVVPLQRHARPAESMPDIHEPQDNLIILRLSCVKCVIFKGKVEDPHLFVCFFVFLCYALKLAYR